MTAELVIESAERKARELLDQRIESVRAVVRAQHETASLREQLAESEKESARLYQAALNDGWSKAELKKLGITETGPKASRRRATQPGGEAERNA